MIIMKANLVDCQIALHITFSAKNSFEEIGVLMDHVVAGVDTQNVIQISDPSIHLSTIFSVSLYVSSSHTFQASKMSPSHEEHHTSWDTRAILQHKILSKASWSNRSCSWIGPECSQHEEIIYQNTTQPWALAALDYLDETEQQKAVRWVGIIYIIVIRNAEALKLITFDRRTYNFVTETSWIRIMPTDIHDVHQIWWDNEKSRWGLTHEESRYLKRLTGTGKLDIHSYTPWILPWTCWLNKHNSLEK